MIVVTELMNKIFSDADPKLADQVADKIEEAKKNGSATLDDGTNKLNFAEVNGDVVIEDKTNGEVTVAKDGEGGTSHLEALTKSQSATEPDVIVPQPAGETKPVLPEDSTLPNVIVDIEPAITDNEKAGVDQHFSLTFKGFESEEDAQRFYSENFEETLTFSEEEVENMTYSANELNGLYERMLGTEDASLAFSVIEQADQLRAYSVLAEGYGHDMSDVIEMCNVYSDEAEDMLYSLVADTDVNEYFSELDENEINAYFSDLDPYTAEVLYSALESGEPMTFSEVEEAAEELKEEAALGEEMGEAIKDMSDEEMDAVFSELTDQELDVMYSILEENPNATFSDINEAFETLYTPLTEMFSDLTDEEFAEATASYSDEEMQILDAMFSDEDENYTYSDFLELTESQNTFSEDDVETLAQNATELTAAADDLAQCGDPHLAAKVMVVADKVADQAYSAIEAGHDAQCIIEACQQFSDEAAAVLEENGIDPASVDENNTNIYGELEELDANGDGVLTPAELAEATQAECDGATYSDNNDGDGTRFFADTAQVYTNPQQSVNPCLISSIN